MGKGIALAFKQRWPAMYREYKKRCIDKSFKMGDVFRWREAEWTIFNLGTQPTWRAPAEIRAIRDSLRTMVKLAEQEGVHLIAMPRIGAGLGALTWDVVRDVILELASATPVQLLVCEDHRAGQPLTPKPLSQ
jgi:O-acetyl-ADP-ribose deacetylase (regulator of RNase III)